MFVHHPKDTKKGTFSLQKVKKNTPNLTYPYVHDLFTTFLIKQNFEKKKNHQGQRPEVRLSLSLNYH